MGIWNFSGNDIGIDLGTTNILITLKSKGIVLTEPSVVAIENKTNQIIETGNSAKEMIGKNPEKIIAVKPIQEGAIADITATNLMLKNMIRKVSKEYNIGKPKIFVSIPTGTSEVETKAVEAVILRCGAKEVYMINEPVASAIGAGMNVLEPEGKMIVDIGGGTTDIAIISLGEIVRSNSIKVAGDNIDKAIEEYIKEYYKISISETESESIKKELGSAQTLVTELTKKIKGIDINTGMPRVIEISSKEIEKAMKKPIADIIDAIISTLSVTPPELSSDILKNGIYLSGGGALIKNLDNLIAKKTGIKTYITDTPTECVAIGTGKVMENFEKYRKVLNII